jgi:hypothetical protein
MAHARKARAVGFNHVALEVGDIDEALAPNVLRGMGLSHLPKNEKAMKELSGKGMALI